MIIGITGNISCGKSFVTSYLRDNGFFVLDADAIVRDLQRVGAAGYNAMVELLGTNILLSSGELDRKTIGNLIFTNEILKKKLNAQIHPLVLRELVTLTQNFQGPLVFWDVPLLFQTGFNRYVDEIWAVVCHKDTQLLRLMQRNGFTKEEALQRMAGNDPVQTYPTSTKLIDNSKDKMNTNNQIEELLFSLR